MTRLDVGLSLKKRGLSFIACLVTSLLLDQLTKGFVFKVLGQPPATVDLIPGALAITTGYNEGGVFGLFRGQNLPLAIITLLALGLIFYFLLSAHSTSAVYYSALGLIAGGALGNFLDRLLFSGVRDFISFYLIRWPVFNLADAFLSVGVGLLFLDLFRTERGASGQKPRSNQLAPQ